MTINGFDERNKGGGERYVSELARALRELGRPTEIFSVPRRLRFNNQHHDGVWRRSSLPQFLRECRNAQVVHVHQLNSFGFDYGMIAARTFGVPLVLTDHGGGTRALGRALGRTRLKAVSAAGFVSGWSALDVDPHGQIEVRSILWGGGDHLPTGPVLDRTWDFGFVGRLLPHKGVHVAVEALPAGRSLVIAGQPRSNEYLKRLRRLAHGKDIEFRLDPGDAEVGSIYRSIDFLLLPSVSQYEGQTFSRPELLGLVVLEALAVGTPAIGSDVAGLGELLRRAGQPVVPAGDVAALRQALQTAERPPGEAMFDRTEFTWRRVAERCLDLYERAGSTSRKRAPD